MSRATKTVVSAAPTSTTKMTGFFQSVRGIRASRTRLARRAQHDLRARRAGARAGASREQRRGSASRRRCRRRKRDVARVPSEPWHAPARARRARTAGPGSSGSARRSARATGPGRTSAPRRSRRCRRAGRRRGRRAWAACPTRDGHRLLGGQAAGRREQRQEEQEPSDQHRQADGQVVPGRVRARGPAKALPLLPVPLVYA